MYFLPKVLLSPLAMQPDVPELHRQQLLFPMEAVLNRLFYL
jgi:hypothetical protein